MDPDDLYGLPLERFVSERTALAKALRADGRRDEAAAIAKLPKPSRAAWAVNQLVRTQTRAVASLFDAGDALQRAQEDVIGGRGDARALRDAAERERAAVNQLTYAARGLLTDEGHGLTAAILDRVSETLHAAALDEEARKHVKGGCLERELRHVGMGGVGALSAPARERAGRKPATRQPAAGKHSAPERTRRTRAERDRADRAERAERDRAARQRAEQAAREQAERLKEARRAAAQARQTAERAARALQSAQKRRDRAAAALDEAEEALAAARDDAEQAARAERLARGQVERLES
jgi:hypothetical protein